MPQRIKVGDLVYKRGEYYNLDDDFGLVTEVVKDKYSGKRYLTIHWLYDRITDTVREEEVSLYKKSVKAYGKFRSDDEGLMSVKEWIQQIRTKIKEAAKDRGG